MDQEDTAETDTVQSNHVLHTANLATLAELEDQLVTLDERPLQDAAIETYSLEDTMDQGRKNLFPFLAGETFDLSTDIENFEFWHEDLLSNSLQDTYCLQG